MTLSCVLWVYWRHHPDNQVYNIVCELQLV
jgi:hypothetical protein